MNRFAFESYGVKVLIASDSPEIAAEVFEIAKRTLLGRLVPIGPESAEHFVTVKVIGDAVNLTVDDEDYGVADSLETLLKFVDARIRLLVGEFAVDRVFLHAGVVAIRGKAVLFPAESFHGKSTLVAELVRRGAEYMSDEYAVFDPEGMVHSYPRPISLRSRTDPADYRSYPIENFSAKVPAERLPVGAILFTQYRKSARWRPTSLTAGEAVIRMIPGALPIRVNPKLTLGVLNLAAQSAIIAQSLRGDALISSQKIIDFVDKSIFQATII